MQIQSPDGYKRLVVILINLTILACMWLSMIFVDPQSALNPFKPQRPRTELALAVSLTAVLPYPIDTPAIVWTPLPTWTFTPTPTETPTPTIISTPSPTFAPPTPVRPTPIIGISIDSPIATKWIDVDIGDQMITAYMGGTALKKVAVSTGVAIHPTVVGRYRIYDKLASQTMTGGNRFSGDYYSLPGVPWVMYFYAGYAIHGTYWHKNFGHPMSHGCVNLTIADAKWFYDWAEVGTLVVTHY